MRKYSVVSMFSGCGGMDLGFKGGFDFLGVHFDKQPFDIVWSNDLNPFACKTYEHNLGHHIHVGSVWDHLDSLPNSCDVVIGGFPCQDISINGKRAGVDGKRSGLYRAMVEAVRATKPKMFVAENVRGLLYSYNQKSLKQVIDDFSDLGYRVSYKLYHAADFGVPQRRERVLIVGVLGDTVSFAPPKPERNRSSWIVSREAIEDLEHSRQDCEFSHVWSLARKSSDHTQSGLSAMVTISSTINCLAESRCGKQPGFKASLTTSVFRRA
jgi:DNA (cytosine-5)-methyltransferase 1